MNFLITNIEISFNFIYVEKIGAIYFKRLRSESMLNFQFLWKKMRNDELIIDSFPGRERISIKKECSDEDFPFRGFIMKIQRNRLKFY